jgi:hypothetical protein
VPEGGRKGRAQARSIIDIPPAPASWPVHESEQVIVDEGMEILSQEPSPDASRLLKLPSSDTEAALD